MEDCLKKLSKKARSERFRLGNISKRGKSIKGLYCLERRWFEASPRGRRQADKDAQLYQHKDWLGLGSRGSQERKSTTGKNGHRESYSR